MGGYSIGAPGRNARRRRRRRDNRKEGVFVGGEPFRVPPCVGRRAGQRSLFHVSVDLSGWFTCLGYRSQGPTVGAVGAFFTAACPVHDTPFAPQMTGRTERLRCE